MKPDLRVRFLANKNTVRLSREDLGRDRRQTQLSDAPPRASSSCSHTMLAVRLDDEPYALLLAGSGTSEAQGRACTVGQLPLTIARCS